MQAHSYSVGAQKYYDMYIPVRQSINRATSYSVEREFSNSSVIQSINRAMSYSVEREFSNSSVNQSINWIAPAVNFKVTQFKIDHDGL